MPAPLDPRPPVRTPGCDGMNDTAWPEGVVARYLTVGGATVDLTVRHTLPPKPIAVATRATCTGCPASTDEGHYRTHYHGDFSSTEEHDPDGATARAREWAQEHAETCRAMPTPGGTS